MAFNIEQPSYRAFRSIFAERTSPIVVWAGAGPSVEAGLPSWSGLRRILVDDLRGKAETLDSSERLRLLGLCDAAVAAQSPWIAFQIFQGALGQSTYRQSIRTALSPPRDASVPETYVALWKLGIRGLLNLNLDRLATRAFVESGRPHPPVEFSGREMGQFAHVLRDMIRPWIINLHGIVDDQSSWVLTKQELDDLFATQHYLPLVQTILTANTVLFCGVNADDVAVGGLLERLASASITSNHFWVTSRTDGETDHWAERVGVQIIRYSAEGGNHRDLAQMLSDLRQYVPEDQAAPPPVQPPPLKRTSDELPAPKDLAREDPELVRLLLNSRAREILGPGSADSYSAYDRFCKEYDEAIDRAYYTTTDPGREELLGYKLRKEVAVGAFGRVYRAENSDGGAVAIKVLRDEVRTKPELLKVFRRGVRSMEILKRSEIAGMVAFREAFEIPAVVVMDWIDGPDLAQAVEAKALDNWDVILRVGRELAGIVRQAHLLPERVLHRDLRPGNVMLKDFWTDPHKWEVIVLDFDLSWHRGAIEKSVVYGKSTVAGYLAPEQIEERADASTRNAMVDSFGLGMTLFFMVSGRHPLLAEHRHAGWSDGVKRACDSWDCRAWRSVPKRVGRLILASTQDRQGSRLDMAEIQGELARLESAVKAPRHVRSAELLAEEVLCRTDMGQAYEWNADKAAARITTATGVTVEVVGDEGARGIAVEIGWQHAGLEDHGRAGKHAARGARSVGDILRSGGMRVSDRAGSNYGVHVRGEADVGAVVARLDEYAKTLERAAGELRFR